VVAAAVWLNVLVSVSRLTGLVMLLVGDTMGAEKLPVPVVTPVALENEDAVSVVVDAAEELDDPDVVEPASLDLTPLSPLLEPEKPGLETPHWGEYWYAPVPSTTSSMA
jgi:hypothetical protein